MRNYDGNEGGGMIMVIEVNYDDNGNGGGLMMMMEAKL